MKTVLQHKRFKTWQEIKLGTGLRTGKDFYHALNEARHIVYVHTVDMLFELNVSTPDRKREVELVRIRFDQLGLDSSPKKTSIDNICSRAKRLGLSPCAEVAPQLILQAKPFELPGSEIWMEYINLFIGMKPLDNYGFPSVFFIGNLGIHGGCPILCSYSATTVGSRDTYPWIFKRREPL